MSIKTPFPAEGTVRVESEYRTDYSFDCITEWFTEHESGDILDRITNDLRANHGVGVEADVLIRENGQYDILDTRDVGEEVEA